jgi:hypothetical protein
MNRNENATADQGEIVSLLRDEDRSQARCGVSRRSTMSR